MVSAVRVFISEEDSEPGNGVNSSDTESWCIGTPLNIAVDLRLGRPTAGTGGALDFELLEMKYLQPEISRDAKMAVTQCRPDCLTAPPQYIKDSCESVHKPLNQKERENVFTYIWIAGSQHASA